MGNPIQVIQCKPTELPDVIRDGNEPLLIKNLATDWPIVKAAVSSEQQAVDYLKGFYNKQPVNTFMAKPEANGRLFYNEQVDGFNFVQTQAYLDDVLNRLIAVSGHEATPTYYVGSVEIPQILPGFIEENDLVLGYENIRKSIWLGNQSTVAPHFDFPDNIAVCVIGQRRFTLYPPEQLQNLYVGPLDRTPAGQAISMVDINNPDLEKFPKFADAMATAITVDLSPGDALYVPSMWWHAVESMSSVNGLVNYWWRNTPDYMGNPQNVLLHAMLGIKSLPKRQRDAWLNMFKHYVFEQPEDLYDHLPDTIRNVQGKISEPVARKIRAQLINKLK